MALFYFEMNQFYYVTGIYNSPEHIIIICNIFESPLVKYACPGIDYKIVEK